MKKLWRDFRAGLFTRSQFITGVTLTMVATSAVLYAFNQLSLNIFSSGQQISSQQVNANFEYLKERIDYLAGGLIEFEGSDTNISSTGSGSVYHTITFDNVIVDFDSTGRANEIITNGGFTITDPGLYEISFRGEMDTVVNTNYFGVYPVKRYIDSLGSTVFQNNFDTLSFYSSSGEIGKQWEMNYNVGDVFFMGLQHSNANPVKLLPNYKFSIRKR